MKKILFISLFLLSVISTIAWASSKEEVVKEVKSPNGKMTARIVCANSKDYLLILLHPEKYKCDIRLLKGKGKAAQLIDKFPGPNTGHGYPTKILLAIWDDEHKSVDYSQSLKWSLDSKYIVYAYTDPEEDYCDKFYFGIYKVASKKSAVYGLGNWCGESRREFLLQSYFPFTWNKGNKTLFDIDKKGFLITIIVLKDCENARAKDIELIRRKIDFNGKVISNQKRIDPPDKKDTFAGCLF